MALRYNALLPFGTARWWRAARPQSLTAALVPVLLGAAVSAVRHLAANRLFLALAGAVALQVATNLFNDYFDHVQGLDADRDVRPDMTIQAGMLTPVALLRGGIAACAVTVVCGLWLVALAGLPVLWLGLSSVLAGVFYTARPLQLGYRCLGEVTVFIFMGPVIVFGAAFVQHPAWDWRPVLASLPVACLVTAILHANNMRDAADDRRLGKHTLANVFGPRFALTELRCLVFGSYIALIALVPPGALPWQALLALLTLPEAFSIDRAACRMSTIPQGTWLIRAVARLHLHFGLLAIAGLALNRL